MITFHVWYVLDRSRVEQSEKGIDLQIAFSV